MSILIATCSAPAGNVALNIDFWSDGCIQESTTSCICGKNSASSMRSASSSTMCRTLVVVRGCERPALQQKHDTHLFNSSLLSLSDATSLIGVLMMMSEINASDLGRRRGKINVPILSRTALSASVAAVALLYNMMRHLRPCEIFIHSLCIWCASSRVGANTRARTPFPLSVEEDEEVEMGDPSNMRIGRRYARVFPVPVGDIAAISRDCTHKFNKSKTTLVKT